MTKVFIVDDDAGFLKEISAVLTDSGYEVGVCEKPAESFSKMRVFQPDCLLLDVRMPLFDGREMLPWLRRQWPKLPIVVVTALNDVSFDDFAHHRVFCLLEKPFNIKALIKAIDHSIQHASSAA